LITFTLDPTTSSRRTRYADAAGQHVVHAGRDAEPGCPEAGREREAPPEQPCGTRQGARDETAGHGDAQTEGHRVRAVGRGSEAPSGEVPRADQRDAADGRGEDVLLGGGGVQDEAAPRRARPGETQAREAEEDRDGFGHGRDFEGGDTGVQGDPYLPVLQGEEEGRSLDEVLPLLLLRLPPNAVRNTATEVPEV